MFEVGKNYEFRIIEGGDEVSLHGIVESYEHPLIKLQDTAPLTINIVGAGTGETIETIAGGAGFPGQIINVTSPHFISAVRKP